MTVATRIISAIGALSVAAAGVAMLSVEMPQPATLTSALAPDVVTVPPADVVLSCPAPSPIDTENQTSSSLAAERSELTYSGAFVERRVGAQTLVTQGDGTQVQELSGTDPLSVGISSALLDQSLFVTGSVPNASQGDESASPAGSVASWASSGIARGLTTASCLLPAATHWLVAGDTATGSTADLVVTNPGLTTSSVSVTLWGGNGQIASLTASSFAVAPGASQRFSLNAAAPGEGRLVVRVESSGGYVSAVLAESKVDGLVSRGVDLAVASQRPARSQVVTGVYVDGSAIDDERTAAIRLLATQRDTTATVTLLGAGGKVILRGSHEVELSAGKVQDISLGGVAQGIYSIIVTADEPVIAGALQVQDGGTVTSTQGSLQVELGTASDFGWVPSVISEDSSRVLSSAQQEGQTLDVVVPIPPGVSGQFAITRLPADRSDLVATLEQMAVGDSAVVGDARQVTVTALDSAGQSLGHKDIQLGEVHSVSFSLNSIIDQNTNGTAIAAIKISGAGADPTSVYAAGLVTQSASVSGSLGTLVPVSTPQGANRIAVSQGPIG